jgi:hypothetical protein
LEPALILKTAAALLGLAALVGMALAGIRLTGKPYPPAALAMAHGLAAGAALTLLVYAAFAYGVPRVVAAAIVLLMAAAAIGAWLNLGYHAQRQPIPLGMMTAHILVAVAGFAVLLFALMGL